MTRLPRERESKVMKSIRVRLRRLGVVLYRRNVVVHRIEGRIVRAGTPGQADLYGWHITTGRHWELEVKAKGNKPTPKQMEWLLECHRLGAVAFWADNCNTAERVAEAILAGHRIAWRDDGTYDLE